MSIRTVLVGGSLLAVGALAGHWLSSGMHAGMDHRMHGSDTMAGDAMQGGGSCAGGRAPEYWVAPMDADFRRDGPGKSPMGMDLVPHCGGDIGGADVAISPQVVQNLGVRTALVSRARLDTTVRAVGRVGWDEDSFQMVHTRAEGWLEQLSIAAEGDDVQAGQTLYALFAPKLAAAETEYLAARGNARLRTAAADRLQALGYTKAQVRAVARRGQAAERQTRAAPGDLTVAVLGARQGQFVMPGTHVMTLADLSTVWLTVHVPESQAAGIRAGLPVVATVAAQPDRNWDGTVDHVYPMLDRATRSLRVRLAFDNADRSLRPGMFAAAVIRTDAIDNVLVVPSQAVIRTGAGARVVKAVGDIDGQRGYDVVAVRTGHSGGDAVQILDGLQAGDHVVTSGQFLIDSEANVDAEALRMAANTVPSGTADATVQSIDPDARTIVLKHGPFEPEGDTGMAMPGMTMGFGLAETLDASHLKPGDRVRVTVENPAPGTYTVTDMQAADGTGMDHGAMDHGQMDHSAAKPPMTGATVKAVDPATRRITLQHARIESLNMPAMTMGFGVADTVDLDAVKPGDAIRFSADSPAPGEFRVTDIAPAK